MAISLIKTEKKKEKIERIDIVKSHVLEFSGTLFLPKTLQVYASDVNSSFIEIRIQRKKYTYITCSNGFCLSGVSREVSVNGGNKITVSFPVKLFFAREV